MRISSMQIFNIARQSMAQANSDMARTQEQMSSGKRVLSPADDPVAATKILQITDELNSIKQYKSNIDIAQNNLNLEESVLDGVNNVIQRMQEMAVAAGNTATLTPGDYQSMATEVGERMDELLNILNTRNANGDFIFGGYKSTQPPFSGNAETGFSYHGDDGQQKIQISDGAAIAVTDSGKSLFMDVNSASNTVETKSNPNNRAMPPAQISMGQVVDQEAYDAFFPKDMVVTFNPDSDIVPPGKNFTVTERGSGRVVVANQAYVPGDDIVVNGVSVNISGNPIAGTAAIPATQSFGAGAPLAFDFSGAGNSQSFTIAVNGRQETLVLDSNIADVNDLVANLNNPANAAKLSRLGISVDDQGFQMPLGVNFTIANGSAAINGVLGIDSAAGTSSSNGQRERAGDQFFINSSEKQGVLTTLARFKNALESAESNPESKAALGNIVSSTLENLKNAQTSNLEVMSKIGGRVNTLESTKDLHLDTEFVSQDVLSQLRDVDYAEAATRLSQQTLILQAAQQSFIRVSQLNLFSKL